MVRFLFVVSAILFWFSVPEALAGEFQIKVVDPDAAPVAGAQVFIYRAEQSAPLQVRSTSGEGIATFNVEGPASVRVEVLAAGFAVARTYVQPSSAGPATVSLSVASAAETVIVTATRTAIPQQETASSISLLTNGEITTMQPVSFSDALRFLPGAVVNVAGQRGGLGSLFVRGGDSRYNKVLVDGVPINEPGGTFDFGSVPLGEVDRVEFQRGTESTLYGSDAMTSVLQVFTRNGTTAVPELRFGADGGNFGTAHGYVSLAGARSRLDYNLFSDYFNTNGQGPNASYWNALQGGNVGVQISPTVQFRVRARHSNRRTGVQGEWKFNGDPLLGPNLDQRARSNNFLASAELSISGPSHWQHRLSGYEYNTRRLNQDDAPPDPGRGCDNTEGTFTDCPFLNTAHINRAGFIYQGDYIPRSWAQTTVGYEFEDENGSFFTHSDSFNPDFTFEQSIAGLRVNHAAYLQQRLTWKRLTVIAGVRYAHNETFGDKAVPRVALSLLALKGSNFLSGTRLRFSYATGIKEPRFEESFPNDAFTKPNPDLKAEQNRSFEAGIDQSLLAGRFSLSAVYYDNLFRRQIDFACCDEDFRGQYVNVNSSKAHGAEVQLTGRLTPHLSLNSAYTYTSTEILEAPLCTPENFCDPALEPGNPLRRRPKHLGSVLFNYIGSRWGANLGGTFVGRRSDSDFFGFGIDHAAGYARVDLGGWYAINSRVTAYANVSNALNNHYNEVVGYPALSASFSAGMRFRIGGE
jgi:vitamin B12 transporter